MIALSTLPAGSRFRLPLTGLTGTVIRQSSGGVVVRYDGTRPVSLPSGETFEASTRPVVIAPGTEVIREESAP